MRATCKRLPFLPPLAALVGLLPLAWSPIIAWAEPPQEVVAPAVFEDFDDQQDYPSQGLLKELLRSVENERSEIKPRQWHHVQACQISGLFQLIKPWEANSALRFSFLETHQMIRFHLWNGQQGITLTYYPGFHHTWAAYAAIREGNAPKPGDLVLWATDGGRYRRCGLGTLELHYHNRHLVLTRGDIVLVSVPFDDPPADVYLECQSTVIRGLAMVQSASVPELAEARPVAFRSEKPAELDWTAPSVDGCSWNKLPDGQVELVAVEKSPAFQAGTRVVKPGLHEFIFLVEDPAPGCGVYLGNEEGRQLCRLAFLRHHQSKRTAFGSLHPGSSDMDRWFDQKQQPAPFAGPHQWFRITAGAGVVKLWTSGDGVYWSQVAPTAETLEGACTQLGIYGIASREKRAIKLARIEVRRFESLMSLAPEKIRDRVDVAPLVKAGDASAWEQLVAESCPTDVPADTWWRACMVRTLSENPRLSLGQDLLDRLQETVLAEPRDLEEKLRLLDETALLMHPGHNQPTERLAQRYQQLGLLLVRQGYDSPFTKISRAMLRSSLWTDRRLPVFYEELLRQELFVKLSENRLPELNTLCRETCYWNRTGRRDGDAASWSEPVRHLVFWAESQVTGRAPKDADQQVVGPSPWRHPLVVTSTREGYNIFAEFAAALEGQTYREACQILASAAQTAGLGLLPDKDQRLWGSLPVAVALAMREHPPLRQAMQEGFGPLGELRFKKAAAEGDEKAVASVALQFYGTTAARDAQLWLGDRRLSAGRFSEAIGHYGQAVEMSAEASVETARARQRLAAAMLGRESGRPIANSIEIGANRLSASQFEALAAQLRQTRRSLSGDPSTSPSSRCFASEAYQVQPWATLESPRVMRPDSMPERELDWAGRQMAVTVAEGQMFVSNQVDLFAFDLETGRQDWVQSGPSVKSSWPLLPMKPLVVQGRVFVRRLTDAKPELACFGSADGRLLWSCKPDSYVASDPMLLGDDLLALTIHEETADKLILMLNRLDVDSGRVRSRAPVAEFFDLWQRRLPIQAAVVEDKIVVLGGGAVLCCDSAGSVDWIRRQLWCPPLRPDYWTAKAWCEQYHEPPLIHEGRVYAMQPGSWCIECLELKTGRLVWRQAVSRLTRLVGLARGRLIAGATDGLLGLDAASGKTAWFYAADNIQQARLCIPDETVLFIQSTKVEGKDSLVPVWLDTESGRVRNTSAWELPADGVPLLGPMVGHDGRQWAFSGPAGNTLKRAILELIPSKAEDGQRRMSKTK